MTQQQTIVDRYNYNTNTLILMRYDSTLNSTMPPHYEVLLIDNNSHCTSTILSTSCAAEATDKYTSIINTISNVNNTMNKWLMINKTRVTPSTRDSLNNIAATYTTSSTYGTDYED